jgi:hypothetical protein
MEPGSPGIQGLLGGAALEDFPLKGICVWIQRKAVPGLLEPREILLEGRLLAILRS